MFGFKNKFLKIVFVSISLFLPMSLYAIVVGPGQSTCLLSLDRDQSENGILIKGNAAVNSNCSIASNSNVLIKSNANVVTSSIFAVGFIVVSGSATLTGNQVTGAAAVDDPFKSVVDAALPQINSSTCTSPKVLRINANATLEPGVYCGGISIEDASVVLNPGLYVMRNGDFKVRGESNVLGDGVTIVFTKVNTDERVGNLSIITKGDVNLKANLDLSNPLAKFVVVQSPTVDQTKQTNHEENELVGNALKIDGIVYTPSRKLLVNNTSDVNPEGSCSNFVAKNIEISGKANFNLQQNNAVCDAIIGSS